MIHSPRDSNRKMRVSRWAFAGALLLGCLVLPSVAQQSTTPSGNQGRQVTLRDQLRVGLKAFTKADFAYIDKVVLQVKIGKLPRRVVDGTFLWARERATRKSRSRELRPMIYFRPALTMRAKRIGVKL